MNLRISARYTLALQALTCASLMPCFARATAPLPLPAPALTPLTAGSVQNELALPDGSLVVAGYFTSVDGAARLNLARIAPQGVLDADWHPALDAAASTLAYDANADAIYVGGFFKHVDGVSQASIARIGRDGTLDTSWDPVVNNQVGDIAVDPANADVYIAGGLWMIDGQLRQGIARIKASGELDTWNPQVHGIVGDFAFDWPNRVVYVGGQFDAVGGIARHGLAKISLDDASVDITWKPEPNLSIVFAVRLDEVHRFIYVGGAFQTVGGASRNRIARLSADGAGVADAWNPNADNQVEHIALDPADASVYVLGAFDHIGGRPGGIAKLADSGSGAADPNWSVPLNYAEAIAINAQTGRVSVGGMFSAVGAAMRLGHAELDASGAPSSLHLDFERPGTIRTVAELADHSIVIGGAFLKVGAQVRGNLARIAPDGSLDSIWMPVANSEVDALAVAPDGAWIFAGGYFSAISGVTRQHLVKLPTVGSGTPDAQWNPGADAAVLALDLSPDGANLYAGGTFLKIGAAFRTRLAKLSASGSGTPDAAWTPAADGIVNTLALDDAGDVVDIGGSFVHVGSTSRARLARLSATGAGALDASWNPGADFAVFSIAHGTDGFAYVAGGFTTLGGATHSHIGRVDASGLVDAGWNPSADANVNAIALGRDGSAYVGGDFAAIGGVERAHIARVLTEPGATLDSEWNPGIDASVSTLSITGDSATLLVGGAFTSVAGETRGSVAALPLPGHYATGVVIAQVTPAAAVVGQAVTLGVSVSSADGIPAGSVSVGEGETSCMATLDADGEGSCVLAFAHAGVRNLVANYSASGDFLGSVSPATAYSVDRAATSLMIVADGPDPSLPGEPIEVGVALAVVAPGVGQPAGSIVVGDGVDSCTILASATSCELTLGTRGLRTLAATFAGDDDFQPSSATAPHSVNRAPTGAADVYDAFEDGMLAVDAQHGVLANDSDVDGDMLVVTNAGTFDALGIGGSVVLASDGSFVYTPPADANGDATFVYMLFDGLESATATVTIHVTPVNDAPDLVLQASPHWPAGTVGTQTLPGFAHVAAFGPLDEAGQHVLAWHVRAIADDSGVLTGAFSIETDGLLHVTLSGASGTATLGVVLQDDGGTGNGGVDSSPETMFSIIVEDVPDRIFANGFEL